MSPELLVGWAKLGAYAVLGLSATGSALGTGVAGMAAVGAWKKCFAQSKAAPFLLLAFIGAPLTQTIYGFILMNAIMGRFAGLAADQLAQAAASAPAFIGSGLFAGLAIGVSAWMQGKAGAGASDALAETGQGFANYIIALGVIETVALFTMVFCMIMLGR